MSACERCQCECEDKVCESCQKIITAAEKERNDISYRYMTHAGI